MGAGSTAGNAGQLMSISGTINGTPESAAYTYDNLGRLVTSNQTTNGSSAQRRFAYDRWGNRTGVWDAVSGGNQIQSVVLQQSGGAPTNRLTSVTTSGVTANYTYDAAGSVTNDGAHSYTYDSENRIVSVDGGSTASYAYDHQNRRYKKTAGSTVTHYVWQGSQVIAEHNGSTGAVLIDYVYSGSRMIAKVSGGTTQYFLSDRLSTRLVLDSSGNVIGRQGHLPFGEDFGESGTQEKHHFTSYERDAESGIDYAVNRGYSPVVGRFQQADPYRASGYIVDPRSWNRYSYVRNDPVNLVDQLGLENTECPNCVSYEYGCSQFPELCFPHARPPFGDGGTGGGGERDDKGVFEGITVSVSWRIPRSSRSPQGELATCGTFELTIRIKGVPEGNPNNIYVSEVRAGNYPPGSIRLVGQASLRQEGKTLVYQATYQLGNIIGYGRSGNLGLKIILGASPPGDPVRLVTTDVNRLGHSDDYIAIRGTIRGREGFKDCPN